MSRVANPYYSLERFIEKKYSSIDFDLDSFIKAHSEKQIKYLNTWKSYVMYYGGRRAGKTLGNCSKSIFVDRKIKGDGRILFASATIQKTKDLYWMPLYRANESLKLGWDFKNAENRIITPYSDIIFRGLKDIPSANLDYGFRIKAGFIEEPQTIRARILKFYLEDVISPGMIGVPYSGIYFTFNPPAFKMPYLEELRDNKKFYKIHTNMWDNPSLSKDDIEKACLNQAHILGFETVEEAKDHPVFQRNIYGNWSYSTELIIFDVNRIKTFTEVPDLKNFRIVLGVDIGGGKAQDAIVALGWSRYEDKVFVLEEICLDTSKKDLEDLALNVKNVYEKYKDMGCTPQAISIDTGGIGERIASILRTRYGIIGLVAAKKSHKMAHLEEMRTEAHKGRLLFHKRKSRLLEEFPQIVYTPERDAIDDEFGLHSDLLDACLYAFRHITSKFMDTKKKEESWQDKIRREKFERYTRMKNRDNGLSNRYEA